MRETLIDRMQYRITAINSEIRICEMELHALTVKMSEKGLDDAKAAAKHWIETYSHRDAHNICDIVDSQFYLAMQIVNRLDVLQCYDYKDEICRILWQYLSLEEYNTLYKKFHHHEDLTQEETDIITKAGGKNW